ncbi:DNA-binding protein SpoVG, cell septation regulator [Fibrobacter sp. UWOV1]|uniref:septation protein SpoVG family protein n=1 Tax=Fibrobacter sp. UWOV1 TaxID=1896215 RepID=UPI0009178350|nr:septation protein SpoVG family protein [Fibrobacter sp. UWOV1]SHK28022.1 DNA-binding protein SpoVG, cell septation regulator [Fibrobacter sp. UWOV1]
MSESIAELKKELERATRMAAMIHAIGEKAVELQSENELLRKRLAELGDRKETKPAESPAAESHSTEWDCLAVTSVQVYPFKEGPSLGHIKGLATIVLNDQIQIRGLRVMDGENGLFVAYPTDPFFKGESFRSIFNPLTRQLRDHIENCVLEKYNQSMEA